MKQLSLIVTPVMLRRYAAECTGTFAYVFFGCGVRIVLGDGLTASKQLLIYLTFGLTLFALTYALSHISAAPFNPAITLGLAVTRRFPWLYVLPYWIAQVGGALVGSTAHRMLLPDRAAPARFGATIPAVGTGQAVGIEVIITFVLMLVAMSTVTDRRVNRGVVGLATGFTITLAGFFAGPLTGGSMNPARSLAPALFAGGRALAVVWIYWIGPLIGAVLGAILYELMRGGEQHALEAPPGIFAGLRTGKKEATPYP
jgi:MIP family channel proteins